MSSIAIARVYQQSFDAHPYGTLALTNGALNALGDVVAQMTQNLVSPTRPVYSLSSLTFSDIHRYNQTDEGTTTIDQTLTTVEPPDSSHSELLWVSFGLIADPV